MMSWILALTLAAAPAAAAEAPRLEALMINGGGNSSVNFQSHLLHLRELHELLLASGIPADRVSVFAADGPDPAADLAVRDVSADDAWLLDGTHLAAHLDTRTRYIDSSVNGVELRPATRKALTAWFEDAAERLRDGDTLLLYVTDHGTKNVEDSANNAITLWGRGEDLSVEALGELLAKLDPGVRVVALMSQCFSGAFANLRGRDNTCGYFSSTDQRPAYGCYPENFDKANVGHSFRFIEALRENPSFPDAQRRVLVSDRTPDVPLRTSDLYLQEMLEREAEAQELGLNELVDRLLDEAWADRAAWEPEIRLLDSIGQAFGFFSPRSLAEIAELADALPEVSRELERFAVAWNAVRRNLNVEILLDFLQSRKKWARRVDAKALDGIDEDERRRLASGLLENLARHTEQDAPVAARLALLNRNSELSRAAHYRMQVRLGALLRMRAILTDVAGRIWLERHATDDQRAGHAALLECEALTLPPSEIDAGPSPELEPFPPYEEDLALTREVLPGWMGVRYRPTPPDVRKKLGLARGATDIAIVFPDSPADRAGMQAGDIVLGTPGVAFDEQQEMREWVVTAPIGEPRPLEILRGDEKLVVDFAAGPYPIETPALPGPPAEGSAAPELKQLETYRGSIDGALASDKGHLLFFWATWCGPCKAAIPELMAFEHASGTPVIAITDERADQIEPFMETRDEFLQNVAIDARRLSFVAYGVSGTPTFVLVDPEGNVRGTWFGYGGSGLPFPGWSWKKEQGSL